MADELAALRAELARKEAALEVASLKEQLAVQDALAQQPPPEEDAGLPTVAELIQAMRAPDDELRGEAITYLCELVDCAFGDDGALLGQAVRDANGVAMLSWMLADASPRVQTQTLLILGNLGRRRKGAGGGGREGGGRAAVWGGAARGAETEPGEEPTRFAGSQKIGIDKEIGDF